MVIRNGGHRWCWPGVVLGLNIVMATQAVLAMCSVGHAQCLVVKKGWSLAVLAIGSVGRQQCWPQVGSAEGGVGPCVLA